MPTRKGPMVTATQGTTYEASMGPRRCRRGRRQDACHPPPSIVASMGPRRCRRGRPRAPVALPREAGFNGAASLPTRKGDEAPRGPVRQGASMGPRRCRRGRTNFFKAASMRSLLQWGRVVADAEGSGPLAVDRVPQRRASMGPRRCRRGRAPSTSRQASSRRALQWGRVVADAEGRHVGEPLGGVPRASMGPRRCRRGRDLDLIPGDVARMLQWGRVVADAEGRPWSRRSR